MFVWLSSVISLAFNILLLLLLIVPIYNVNKWQDCVFLIFNFLFYAYINFTDDMTFVKSNQEKHEIAYVYTYGIKYEIYEKLIKYLFPSPDFIDVFIL